MNLEEMVPPLELCKQIQKGCFADSVLIWHKDGVIERSPVFCDTIPAPTLLEIMDAIDKTGCSYDFCEWDQNNITASALKAWGSFTDWGKLG